MERSEKELTERCEGEGQAERKIISERWRVHCGWRWVRGLGGRFFLALRQVASKLGEHVKPKRLVAAATRIHRQDTVWGTAGQLVGGTV